jgi:hypothetical protein
MTSAICTLLLLGFQAPVLETDPAALVALLGSRRYADRQSAADSLERLGRAALPALRVAQDSPDLEVRTRSVALLRRIEGAMLVQPTMLKLDFNDATLSDIISSLSDQSGFKIGIYPDGLMRSKGQKFTLRAAGPVSFWRGIDLLCDAARLRPNPGVVGAMAGRAPTFALVAGTPLPILPSWDHGPFRVSLIRLHSERDVSFGTAMAGRPVPAARRSAIPGQADENSGPGARPIPILNVQFNFQLQVSVEPRLSMTQSGGVQLLEAVDDVGNALAQPASDARPQGIAANRGLGHLRGISSHQLQLVVPLNRPDPAGKTIKVLKGAVPILVASRRPEPLIVPIAGAAGKSFENRETAVVIHAIRKSQNQIQTTIDMTIRSVGDAVPIFQADPDVSADSFQPQPDAPQQQIEVVDHQGRVLPWYQTSHQPELSRIAMTLNQFGPGSEPKEIRFYSLTKAITNVAFEFRDIPMP